MKVGEVEKGVKKNSGTTFSFLDAMEVGDSVLVDDVDEKGRKRLGTATRGRKKSSGKAYSIQKEGEKAFRVFRDE